MKTEEIRTRGWIAICLAVALVAAALPARPSAADDEQQRVAASAQVLQEMVRAEDAGIPDELLKRARAIAIVPHVVRGAFVVGGRWGKGVVATRDARGQWAHASFVDLSGASVGFQIGGDATDLIMVFIEDGGLKALLEDKVELGANVSAAAGPLGRSAELGTNATLDAAIYAYSRSKGLFAGAALDGTVVKIDDSANEKAFGRRLNHQAVLTTASPAIFRPFLDAVAAATPRAAK